MTVLPRLHALRVASLSTARRFPTALGAAAVAAAAAVASIDGPLRDTDGRLWLTAVLGIPLFTTASLCLERTGWSGWRAVSTHVAGISFLVAFYVLWPGWTGRAGPLRWAQYAVGLHLLVAVLPYITVGERNGFWNYNRVLLQRFVVSALFTLVLFAGLSIALVALDRLFGLAVDDDLYLKLWAVLALLFSTWVFLSGVPDRLKALDDIVVYPTGIRIFAQYILAPLVAVYVVILTAYFVKIVVTASWPSGWIGWLVSSVAVTGILSLLLLDPVRRGNGRPWTLVYARWFYVALFPSIVMLLMAIGQRIGQYGITEPRYFLVILALWLGGIAVYWTAVSRSTIKVIPLTLAVLAFATSIGPWGAYRVSQRSQTNRLEALFEGNGILEDGVVQRVPGTIADEDSREISAILRYLTETHGTESIADWFPEYAPAAGLVHALAHETSNRWSEDARTITEALGVPYYGQWQLAAGPQYFTYRAISENTARAIGGFDYAVSVPSSADDTVTVGLHTLAIRRRRAGRLTLSLDGREIAQFDLAALATQLGEVAPLREVPAEALRLESDVSGVRTLLYLVSLSGRFQQDESFVDHAAGVLYLDLPK